MSDSLEAEGIRALFLRVRSGGLGSAGPSLRRVRADDPGVMERFVSDDPDAPRQVVTAYPPLEEPPASYPADLPFIARVEVFVTDFPEGGGRGGARWVVRTLLRDVMEEVISALGTAGWVRQDDIEDLLPYPGRKAMLRRGLDARLVLEANLEPGTRVVQLLALV